MEDRGNNAWIFKRVYKTLSDEPLFLLINSYTTGLSGGVMSYLARLELEKLFPNLVIESEEIGLKLGKGKNLVLLRNIYSRRI